MREALSLWSRKRPHPRKIHTLKKIERGGIKFFIWSQINSFKTRAKIRAFADQWHHHPRRPRGSQSGRVKRRDESFQAWAEEPLGTESHQTISKQSSECWLLIGHKKCFVLLCPIGEQHLLSSFREFVHDGYWFDHGLSGSCTKEMHAVGNLSVWYNRYISKYW